MEELTLKLVEVISQVQAVAPEVWRIAYRQAFVNAIVMLVWGIIILSVGGTLVRLGLYFTKRYGEEERDGHRYSEFDVFSVLCYVFGGIGLVVGIVLVITATGQLANPEWRAIELIVGLVGK
jgi:hypothetical protein